MQAETAVFEAFNKSPKQNQDPDGDRPGDTSTRLLSDHSEDGAEMKIEILTNGVTNNKEVLGQTDTLPGVDRMLYRISESPPIFMLIFYAIQQGLLGIARPVTAAVIVCEVTCAQKDDYIKTQILSASFFVIGISSFMVTTFGIRLPIYHNPDFFYLLPLMIMTSSDEWQCPEMFEAVSPTDNTTVLMAKVDNGTAIPAREIIVSKLSKLNGSIMLVASIHFIIGFTGLVGIIIRYIGPVTIVPTLLLSSVLLNKVVVKMSEPYWTVAILTCAVSFTLSLCLATKKTPIPLWSRRRGFYIMWYPLHKTLSVLLSMVVGWALSAVLTTAGAISDDPESLQYLARTDARSHIIAQTEWFTVPYPGKLALFSVSTSAVVSLLGNSLFVSILDSIGDYNTCARVCRVPQPPRSAFNRGIAVAGLVNFLGGAFGCCHTTFSSGSYIATISITKVASRSVFQCCAIIYIMLAFFGKFAAVFVTIPLPVLGGITFLVTGLFIGFVISSLQTIDLNSNRNLAIIGTAVLMGMMLPHWVNTRPGVVDTGNQDINNFLLSIISNPSVVAAIYACFMDNIIPGSPSERGLVHQMKDLDDEDAKRLAQSYEDGLEVYRFPFIPQSFYKSKFVKYIPIFEYTGR